MFSVISVDDMGSRLFVGTVRVTVFKGEVTNTYKIRSHAVYNVDMVSLGISGPILGRQQTSRLLEYMSYLNTSFSLFTL